MLSRAHCAGLDTADRLAPLREQFALPRNVIYLDGNSLGVLPNTTAARMQQVVEREWGDDLIRSWNTAGWIELPRRVGDKIARLIGAGPNEVVAADSTSVNLFKVLAAALHIQRPRGKRFVLSERTNFPTDLYIAAATCKENGAELILVDAGEIEARLNDDVAVLMLTEVNYRTGQLLDMKALTRAAHAAGALVIWDLAHSAGALPVDLHGAEADFAVGCGYKYLNGGPGAPAFVWVHPRHVEQFSQPLAGWMGHAAPFEFTPHYRPAAGIARYLCGTPSILSMAALECGVDTVLAATPLGGMTALREKSIALTDLFIRLIDERCASMGFALVSPREAERRGSQVCLSRDQGAFAMVQALIARGVIGDFRAGGGATPDILRFGFTPLYTRFVDVWDAVEQLVQVMTNEEWRESRFNQRTTVT